MFEPGFVIESNLGSFLQQIGVQLSSTMVLDKASHYGQDVSQVAVTGYSPHPITRDVSYTFFPGIRGLTIAPSTPNVKVSPLMLSSPSSIAQPFATHDSVTTAASPPNGIASAQVLAAAIEGTLKAQANQPFRAVVIGDADFAISSYYPYVANSALVLAMTRWLLREDSQVAIASRIPAPEVLLLTKSQKLAVFVIIEVAVPLAVVLTGVWIWWRRR